MDDLSFAGKIVLDVRLPQIPQELARLVLKDCSLTLYTFCECRLNGLNLFLPIHSANEECGRLSLDLGQFFFA